MARPQEQVPHAFHAETPLASASKSVPPGNTIRVAIPLARARAAFTSLCLCPVPLVSRTMSSTRYHCDMTDFRWSENVGERRETVASGGLGQSCASS
jgi:hypothetical protein